MKILIGCDVDPALPGVLKCRPAGDIWEPVRRVRELLDRIPLPPITWLIRCDESVRFSTGDFASGYLRHASLWQQLESMGHEIGWHMHLLSPDPVTGDFRFDPDPAWLTEAHAALARHVAVRATRTGWDYGSNLLFQKLDKLGIGVDFSALPGSIAYLNVAGKTVAIDWLRCPEEPYFPGADDYQSHGQPALRMLEVPITHFQNSPLGKLRRMAGRVRRGVFDIRGLRPKTRTLTTKWNRLPAATHGTYAFYFHPVELSGAGMRNFIADLALLRDIAGAAFMTASGFAKDWRGNE